MLLDCELKILGRDVPVKVGLHKVLHHGLKPCVALAALIEHHHAKHMQNKRALRIDQELVRRAGFGVAQAIALRYGSNGVGLLVPGGRRRLDDLPAMVFPKVDELVIAPSHLHVKRS